jgi:uncharacterized membrane protein YqjE
MYNGAENSSVAQRVCDVCGNVLAMVGRHFKLATLEAREEVLVLLRFAGSWVAIAALAFFAFALLNTALIVLIGMATGRWVATLFGFAIFYFLAAAGLGWRLYQWWQKRPGAFSATYHELDRTKEWLSEVWPAQSNRRS